MRSRNKNMLIVVLLGALLVMAVAYAAFSQNLTINAASEINSKWDVRMTNIAVKKIMKEGQEVEVITGTATDESMPSVSDRINAAGTEATFSSILRSPGDSVTYDVTIENKGTLKAKVSSINWTNPTFAEHFCMKGVTIGTEVCTKDDPIYYEFDGLTNNAVINPNGTQHVYVTVTYYNDFTYQPTDLADGYITGEDTGGNSYFQKDATLRVDYVQTK